MTEGKKLDPSRPEFEVKQSRGGDWMARRKGVREPSREGSRQPPLGYLWEFAETPQAALSAALGQSQYGAGTDYPDIAKDELVEALMKIKAASDAEHDPRCSETCGCIDECPCNIDAGAIASTALTRATSTEKEEA